MEAEKSFLHYPAKRYLSLNKTADVYSDLGGLDSEDVTMFELTRFVDKLDVKCEKEKPVYFTQAAGMLEKRF